MNPRTRMIVGAVVGVLLVLYLRGNFDTTLYPMGLNFNDCGQNGYGAVFCGDALKDYERRVVRPAEHAQREADRIGQRASEIGQEAECIAYPRRCGGY